MIATPLMELDSRVNKSDIDTSQNKLGCIKKTNIQWLPSSYPRTLLFDNLNKTGDGKNARLLQ